MMDLIRENEEVEKPASPPLLTSLAAAALVICSLARRLL
jgi:hypothetical protein